MTMTTRRAMMFTASLLVLAALPCWSLTNLLPNPLMEDANGDGIADTWQPQVHTDMGAEGELGIDAEIARSGTSQRIEHTSDNAAWIRISQDGIAARDDVYYRAEAWVRATGSWTVILYEHYPVDDEWVTTRIADGEATDGWQHVSGTIVTKEGVGSLKLSLISDGPGTVWFDDAGVYMIAERPTLRVPMVDRAPDIDGSLDDRIWREAAEAEGFMVLNGDGEMAEAQTRALALRDNEALYIGFECEEPNIENLVTLAEEDGSAVWQDDCVEVFLDTEHDRAGYVHLGVSAGGAKWQERRIGTRFYTGWFDPGGEADVPAPEWTAAATIGEDRWWVELRLPFDQVGGLPDLGETWGANFARTRRAVTGERNSTWSYTPGQYYAVPDRFGTLAFAVGRVAPPTTVSRGADYTEPQPTIIPTPQSLSWKRGAFRPDGDTVLAPAGEDLGVGAEMLREDLSNRFGLAVDVRAGGRPGPNVISMRVAKVTDLPPGGYELSVTPNTIDIAGADARGVFYGIQTLRQMLVRDGNRPMFYGCSVRDWPDTEWRAWHIGSPMGSQLQQYRDFIDFLALLKYDTICLEINDRLQYERHPEIARAGAPTKEELRDLAQYARERHFRIFPQLATFAHFGYALNKPQWRHLAEAPEGTTIGHRDRFNYCPSNPETYPLVFDLMEELIEVFGGEYFHIGHDEATFDDIGTCALCEGKDTGELFVGDVVRLHDWLAERGMRTLMWGDMFLPSHNGMKYGTAALTDELPKDILICDWHYASNYDFDASLSYWEEHGFQVLGCPWYEPQNVWGFAEAVYEHNAVGMMGTTWSSVQAALSLLPHLPPGWLLGAENSWSVGKPAVQNLDWLPTATFHRLWRLNDAPQPREFELVDLAPFCNESTIDEGRMGGWLRLGGEYDLRNLPTGQTWIGETPFALVDPAKNDGRSCVMLADGTTPDGAYPTSVWEIPVGMEVRAIRFLHTTSAPDARVSHIYDRQGQRPGRVGRYLISYDDGGEEIAQLTYEAEISDWNSRRGPAQAIDLWQGQTSGGVLVTLGVWEWRNPHPDREVESVSMISAEGELQPILLGVTLVP